MVGFPTDRCSFLFHYLGRNHINFQCGKGGRFTKGNAVNYLLPAAILAAFLNPILASDTHAQSLNISTKRSDYITQEDVDRAGGGYKLNVPGVGVVTVGKIRAPEKDGMQCKVNKQSLMQIIRDNGNKIAKPHWLKMKLHHHPAVGNYCLGLGGGCYIIVASCGDLPPDVCFP